MRTPLLLRISAWSSLGSTRLLWDGAAALMAIQLVSWRQSIKTCTPQETLQKPMSHLLQALMTHPIYSSWRVIPIGKSKSTHSSVDLSVSTE